MSEKSKRVDAIFIFDLNRKSDLDFPSDKDIQLSKLLYYHPEDRSVDDKLSHFGLIEGLITLSKNYTDDDLEFIRSKLYTTAVVKWFDSVYLSVVFFNRNTTDDEKDDYSYHSRNNMLKTILRNSIRMFEMFYGSFQDNLVKINHDEMTLESLQEMLENILPTFMNNSTKTTLNFLKDVEAFKKFHTNMNLSLDVQIMIDDLYNEFEAISKSLLIYNRQVLHYNMELDEVFLIYCYIVRYQGNISKVKSMNVKWPENNEMTIVDSMDDNLFSPQIFINNTLYTLTMISTKNSTLVLLLDTNDPLIVVNSIYEYMNKLQLNLITLEEKLSKFPVLTNTKFFALNTLSKTINSVGFDNLNNESIEELSMIYDLHDILGTCREQLYNTHIKTKNTWVGTKFNNSREVYYVNSSNNNKASLSESKLHFEKFVSTYFNGIYFI
ncbi:hypothetical protein TpMuguga_04g02630 [Theileria parva strain Muguga]|uniref:uncharacterized protein n=1 Tax=Theileria parva strain Muguga TaxID=333668 RepID=UPI001C61DEFD|nr:uncharacterized protein TpMuguga_04g02630 [Theileria parva strain Muguga]KAF5153279.1 hypothetical protein TpMuguga_04g02630 [Theileria parva strain Muguga]